MILINTADCCNHFLPAIIRCHGKSPMHAPMGADLVDKASRNIFNADTDLHEDP